MKKYLRGCCFFFLCTTSSSLFAGTWLGVLFFRDVGSDHLHIVALDANKFSKTTVPAYVDSMDIWYDKPSSSSRNSYYANIIVQLKSSHRSLFIYSEKPLDEILEVWDKIYSRYHHRRSLLTMNCAQVTSMMIEEIFGLMNSDFASSCARTIFCLWLPSEVLPVALPQKVFKNIKEFVIENDFPHIIPRSRQTPNQILRELIDKTLNSRS